ncbi:glycosyltransferase family 4 protein [Georgenia sp. AZ-5]|uniref:glycosyltransferase family 4 protein n=1 Tax=Georgenia sp. AZ-5 TaxID=3367526 RepID=UPI003754DF6D
MPITLVTWTREGPSGGNTYNRELVAALRAAGREVDVRTVPGAWPAPAAEDRRRLARLLRELPVVLVDGIVACAAPEAVRGAVAAGRTVAVLVHMPLADEVGLAPVEQEGRATAERAALHAASRVIATSRTAAADLAARYGLDVRVAPPGARPAPQAWGARPPQPPRLLTVAALTPTKDQLTLVRALARVHDLGWTARLVGPTAADPGYADAVRAEIAAAGLGDRLFVTGPLVGAALEAQWAAADLLVLPSRTETFGLVVLEALAHGIPAVVPAGTGAVEALGTGAGTPAGTPPGRAVPPSDVDALAAVLREWLGSPRLRAQWRRAATERRTRLPGWDDTARRVLAALA